MPYGPFNQEEQHNVLRNQTVHQIDDLLVLLQVFVGIVEEFEEIRGVGRSESGCSGAVLVWVILAR